MDGSVLTLRMVVDVSSWHPSGANGQAVAVAAFGEEGSDLSVPGPLIRVREGTAVVMSLRNALPSELRVYGLCSRPGPCEAVTLPPKASRDIRFTLAAPGTYHYWASSQTDSLSTRPREESQLGGAIVVDARGEAADDRVFVISILDDARQLRDDPRSSVSTVVGTNPVFAINGASWPHTERLGYKIGEPVRWRVVNLSNVGHAMHLHGFHFELQSIGNGVSDRTLAPGQRRTEVTEFVGPGRTFALAWTPTRPGNWLFHCHMVEHMAAPSSDAHAAHAHGDHGGMAGLVLGIEVTGAAVAESAGTQPRRFGLHLQQEENRYGTHPGFRVDVVGTDAPKLDAGPVPGPILVLHRGEPVEIEIVNRLRQPTAIHWHGMELASYFDGVPGISGEGRNVAPPIAPGQTFVARFTPPRAGTFIYHTHWHDNEQLAGGLYGALIVIEPGEIFDPAVDHVVMIGLNGVLETGKREPFALNGRASPAPIRLRVGVPNRLRLINITANNDALSAFVMDRAELAVWRPVAKDGAALPPEQMEPRPARQLVSVGETYDFELQPTRRQDLWLEVRRANGEWVLQAPLIVR